MTNYALSNNAAHPGRRAIDATGPGPIAQGKRVLIVDDEFGIRILLARMLKPWGYATRHVGSATEALDVMGAGPADILLCDVAMPEHDGLWLAEQVHARWPRTVIIMSTARQDAYTVQTSRKVGAVAYVTKPFNPFLLREALDRASGR